MLTSIPLDVLAQLGVFALVDSTSFGTLLIPLWLMLAPGRVRPGRVLVFLATVAVFYWGLGIALLLGAGAVHGALGDWLETDSARMAQLVLGVALFAGSFLIGRKKKDADDADVSVAAGVGAHVGAAGADGEARPAPRPAPGRLARWRERAMGSGDVAGSGLGSLILLALGAALIESASMVPYLAGIGLLTAADVPTATGVAALGAYVVVMVLPALVLLALRIGAGRVVEPTLRRFEGWMTRNAGETTSWIVGIVGFLLARDAAAALGLFGQG